MNRVEYDHVERPSVKAALRDFLVQYRRRVNKSAMISFRPMVRRYDVVFRHEIPIRHPDQRIVDLWDINLDTCICVTPHTIMECRLFYNKHAECLCDRIGRLCHEPIKLREFLEQYQGICDDIAGEHGSMNIVAKSGVLFAEFCIPLSVDVRDDGFTFVMLMGHEHEIISVILTDADLGIENDASDDDESRPSKKRKRQRDVSSESLDDD